MLFFLPELIGKRFLSPLIETGREFQWRKELSLETWIENVADFLLEKRQKTVRQQSTGGYYQCRQPLSVYVILDFLGNNTIDKLSRSSQNNTI